MKALIFLCIWLHLTLATASNGGGGNITLDYEANITVVCLADYIEVTLKKDNFPGLIVNDSLLHLEDMACSAGYKDDTMVKFTFGLESCGTMQDKSDDKLIYKNKVYLTADPETDDDAITRKHSEVIPFQCSYDRKATISKVSYSPRSTLVVTDAEGYGNFTYEMDMYKDDDFSEEVTEFPYEVGLGLPMYFGFRVLSADSKLDVFPDVCKATAGSDYDSTPDHLIIENACSRDNTLKYTYEQKSEQFFSVAAFRFKEGYDDVFIHCKLTVCREDDSGSRCARGCEGGRRRRSINEDDLSVSLTIGPMKLTNKKDAFGDDAVDKQTGAEAASSNSGMVIIVAALVGVLGTVAIGLTVAVVIIGRRRRYSAVNKGTALIVAEEM